MIGFLENEEILSIFEFRYKSNNTQYVRGKQGHMIHFSEGKSLWMSCMTVFIMNWFCGLIPY